ncbi:MAG: hypothetical protein ACI83B_003574 [Sediminicola sp.]|jgi:hypothetical protein
MNIEKNVIDLVSSINFMGLNQKDTEQRKLFLCLVTFIMMNCEKNKNHQEILSQLFSLVKQDEVCADIFFKLENATKKIQSQSHQVIMLELKQRLLTIKPNLATLLNNISWSEEFIRDNHINQQDKIVVYDRLLQRLQGMNVKDKLDADFSYNNTPVEFAQLIHALVGDKNGLKIYDPLSIESELITLYANIASVVKVKITESRQSDTYIHHKLLLANVTDFEVNEESYSQITSLPEVFNVAFTVIDPVTSSKILKKETEKLKAIEDKSTSGGSKVLKYPEHSYIKHIYDSLDIDGVGIIFVGKGPLHRKTEIEERNTLLALNAVDAVIELPAKLLGPKTPSMYALVIKKSRSSDSVLFVDASASFKPQGRKNYLIDAKEIGAQVHSKSLGNNCCKVKVSTLIETDSSLVVSNYASAESLNEVSINEKNIRTRISALQLQNDNLISEVMTRIL